MNPVIPAVAPVFGLVLAGHALHRMRFPARAFWPASERLTYYVLFPALLVGGLSGREFESGALPLSLAVGGAILAVAALLWLLRARLPGSGPVFTSIFQGSIRPNTYIALSLAAALLGPDWMKLSAVALLTAIPLVNVLCVLVLSRHGEGNATGAAAVLRQLAGNPLILACVTGMLLNGADVTLPGVVADFLDILGRAALPMGLLAVGAGLRPAAAGGHLRPAMLSSAAHLLVLPAAAWLIATGLEARPDMVRAALIFTAIPVAASSFILARQMGGDHEAMAAIITVQTALSVLTIPVLLSLA